MDKVDLQKFKTYEEFVKQYWYREELKTICKQIGIDASGNKQELLSTIQAFYKGEFIQPKKRVKIEKKAAILTLESELLESGFALRNEYRDFFAYHTGDKNFHYTSTMAATLKKVREHHDETFTVKDLIDVYLGNRVYAVYDHRTCEWNQFLKDFCADEGTSIYQNKLKTAAMLWNHIRTTTSPKKYTTELLQKNKKELHKYCK